jgi:hypothetical protein
VEKAIVATVVFYGFFLWSRQFLGAGLRTGYPSHLTGGLVHGQMSRTLPLFGKVNGDGDDRNEIWGQLAAVMSQATSTAAMSDRCNERAAQSAADDDQSLLGTSTQP